MLEREREGEQRSRPRRMMTVLTFRVNAHLSCHPWFRVQLIRAALRGFRILTSLDPIIWK